MNLSYANVITTVVLLVSVGIWVGGTDAKASFHQEFTSLHIKMSELNDRQSKFEDQILIWLDDAEDQRKWIVQNVEFLHDYNKKQDPNYKSPGGVISHQIKK